MTVMTLKNNRFAILDAVRFGYVAAAREAGYLARYAALPFVLHFAAAYWVVTQGNMSVITVQLYTLPATFVTAWYQFLIVRKLLLGERADRLPDDPEFRRARGQTLQLSVILSVLFVMGMTAIGALMLYAGMRGAGSESLGFKIVFLGLIGMMIWYARIVVLPVLAAVDQPIRPFVERIDGFGFSFRILGVLILCMLPPSFILQLFMPRPEEGAMPQIGPEHYLRVATLEALLKIACATVITAALTDVLRQMLGREKQT